VKLLLDTHILIWAAQGISSLPPGSRALLAAPDSELVFSVASLWEIAIKHGIGRKDFQVDPRVLRRGLIDNDYHELPILSAHAVAIDALPPIHRDPFDRLLIAQAMVEGITLITNDETLARYPGDVRLV